LPGLLRAHERLMTPKSANQRKATERERKRTLGLVPGEVWAHPADWPNVRRYVERKLRKRVPVR
jgi:hypothetical protein